MATSIGNESEHLHESYNHNVGTECLRYPCSVCITEQSQYTCPRCNIRYCSVKCYKDEKHLACSEAFYKDCVINELKDNTTNPEDRAKVLEMLQKLEDDVPPLDSDEDVEDLEDRLNGLDLDNDTDEIWQRLTDTERSQFKAMLRDQRLVNLVEVWTPWWKYKNPSLVEDTNREENMKALKNVPKIKQKIPHLDSLLKNKTPSVDIRNSVINVLYCYAYIVRLYNGSHWDNPNEAIEELLELSGILTSTQTYSTPQQAVHACIYKLPQENDQPSNRQFHISVIQDVCDIIEGPSIHNPLLYSLAVISDIYSLLNNMHKDKSLHTINKTATNAGNKVFKAKKKIEFLLSWCQQYGLALKNTVADLTLEICTMSSELAAIKKHQNNLETSWKEAEKQEAKRPLIEEL